MGTFRCSIIVASPDGRRTGEVQATVDTGAAYTTIPSPLLRELGVAPTSTRRLLLADGSRRELPIGEARVTVNGDSVSTVLVFGSDDGPALLGAYTLEGLGLAGDPVERRLVPANMIMYGAHG